MPKRVLLAIFLIAASAPVVLAQTGAKPDKTAIRIKKDSCEAEATVRKLDKPQRKAFIAECMKK